MKRMLDLIGAGDLPGATDFLDAQVGKLTRAGADFAFFASNTPHAVFREVQERSTLTQLSIMEAACDSARGLGLKRAGLFGTRFTMQSGFYPQAFARRGIDMLAPRPE
jgi:aspartate racemase